MEEKTTKLISIRITDSMYHRLKEDSKAQGRPIANYIKAIIAAHYESTDRLKKISERK